MPLLPALLYAAAMAAPPPPAEGDARAYREAMQCKVLVEPLQVVTKDPEQAQKVAMALAFWTRLEHDAGVKIGKNYDAIVKDELLFGIALPPDALARAALCVRGAALGAKLRS